ncbi:hypothetical protein [Rhodanobacter sp. PCA2]|uniref:hypothetical protein n=1 Tax=Rhodanobacter sp. PCA2 TaxID=2006117 RepID=UPI0015E6F56B|nr:hypothetical protein [Rhodanobacter sp. PCA2]MBA2079837.1 hypothetical protein [Rhodanobacter sp. PCA2]
MQFTPERVLECVTQAPWNPGQCLRLFWIQVTDQPRGWFAKELHNVSDDGEAVIGLPLRDPLFTNSNILMSDANQFFDLHRELLESLAPCSVKRLSIVVVATTEFRLSQGGSPVALPPWFPVAPSRETYFAFEDFGASALVLLNAPEARIENVAELVFDLESALLGRLYGQLASHKAAVEALLAELHDGNAVNATRILSDYRIHLDSISNVRGYRPGAKKDVPSLVSQLLRRIVRVDPNKLVALACKLAQALSLPTNTRLKPVAFTWLLRVPQPMVREVMNAHAILLALLAAYQAQNASAHAGEYGTYPVALVYHASIDLRRCLREAAAAMTAPA